MWQTIRKNAVSLISLAVAVSALSYNTWRNEKTEHNRNVRVAGFETLKELAALQVQVNRTTFHAEGDEEIIDAWSRVLFIQDLAAISSPHVTQAARELENVWRDNVEHLSEQEANRRISAQIVVVREDVMRGLRELK